MKDIKTAQLQPVIDYYAGPHKEIKYGKEVKNSGLSSSSLQKIKALLTQLFDYAQQQDIVQKNYAAFVQLPKAEKTDKEPFTALEIQKIEKAAAAGVPYADCVLMMIYTGFRVSEFLELTPFNYDPKTKTLTGGKKTDAGRNRIVPVHHKIQQYIDAWLKKGAETIICRDNGTAWTAGAFRKLAYYPVLEQIGVRKLPPHSTRHTFATLGSAAGLRPEDLQALLGHESYEVTAETYIHQSEETLRKAIERIS